MPRSIWKPLVLSGLVLGALASAACGDDALREEGDGQARLRVVHAVADAPEVDVYVSGKGKVLSGVAFTDASGYLVLEPGQYTVDVRPAGAPETDAPVITASLTAGANQKVTAFAVGSAAEGAPADAAPRIKAIVEDFGDDVAGKSQVVIVHGSPGAGNVDIDVGNDGNAELTAVARYADSGVVPLDEATGAQIGVEASGGGYATAFTLDVPEGQNLFVVAVGDPAKPNNATAGFSLLVLGETGGAARVKQNPWVYAMHGSPDAPAVDVFVDDAEAASDFAYGTVIGPLAPAPGPHTVEIYGASASPPVGAAVADLSATLSAGEVYFVVAAGELAPEGEDEAIDLFAFNGFAPEAGKHKLAVIHASGDTPTVDAGTIGSDTATTMGSVVFDAVAFGAAAGPVALDPGTVDLGVAVDGNSDLVLRKANVTLTADKTGFLVAVGALGPEASEQPIKVFLVDTTGFAWTATDLGFSLLAN